MLPGILISKVALQSVLGLLTVAGVITTTASSTQQPESPAATIPKATVVQSVVSLPMEETPSQTVSPTASPEGEGEKEKAKETAKSLPAPPKVNLQETLKTYDALFASPTSLGMLVIGSAEGTYRVYAQDSTLYVQQTPAYFGHTDPGNLSWGDVVTNYGPCSDQGRSKGNITQAEAFCVARSRQQLPTHLQDLVRVGIDPNISLEAVLNTADLYNQASPIHSRRFPEALAIAYQGGLRGVEAYAWARTASFYLNESEQLDVERGRNRATGLLGICARNTPGITQWDCVYRDQMRRVKAITDVVDHYRKAGSASSG
jgi:hypothetical protein